MENKDPIESRSPDRGVDSEADVEPTADEEDSRPKRTRRPTAKGLENLLQGLIRQRRRQEKRLERLIEEVERMLQTEPIKSAVQERIDQVDDVLEMINETHDQLCLNLRMSDHEFDFETEERYISQMDEKVFNLKHKVNHYFKEIEESRFRKSELSRTKSVGSRTESVKSGNTVKTQKSKVSSRYSSRFSVEDRAIEEKIKLVELETESAFLDEKLRIQMQAEKIKLNEAMAKARARVNVYEPDEDSLPERTEEKRAEPKRSMKQETRTHEKTRLEEDYFRQPDIPRDIAKDDRKPPPLNPCAQRYEEKTSLDPCARARRHEDKTPLYPYTQPYEEKIPLNLCVQRYEENTSLDPCARRHEDKTPLNPCAQRYEEKTPLNPYVQWYAEKTPSDPSARRHGEKTPLNPCAQSYEERVPLDPCDMKYEDVLHGRKLARFDEKGYKYKDSSHATPNFSRTPEDFHSSAAEQTNSNRDVEPESESMVEMLCRLLRQQAAPVVDMESFDGNPMDYHFFIATFREVVEKNVIDARGRLTRLIKYTSGEARELIQHCIHLPQTIGYETARDLLQRRYGSPYTVISAYRKEIKMWPTIKAGDAVGFRRFHIFLVKCQSISANLTWNMLENQDMICTLLAKLPVYVIDRWNRQVLNIRRRQKREPRFADFVDFVDEESVLVSDPLFSRQAVVGLSDEKPRKNKLRNYAISKTPEVESATISVGSPCPLCGLSHDLDECTQFLAKSVDDRSTFVAEKKLCFGCYTAISSTHTVRTCPSRRICKHCNGKHPSGLHGYIPKKRNDTTLRKDVPLKKEEQQVTNYATRLEDSVSMCVVPVKIRKEGTEQDFHTFAMLDNCSQGTFVTEDLLRKLEIPGTSTRITIKTLSGETSIDSTTVTGLEVSSSLASFQDDWVKLPKCYAQSDLSVSSDEIAIPEKIRSWKYLERIKQEICQTDEGEIGILIGANCTKGLEPTEIISSKNGGPYAFKTRLGWCVVGPLQSTHQRSSLACNKILVNESDSLEKFQPHCFAVCARIKDRGITDLLETIYRNDFTEPQLPLTNSTIRGAAEEVSQNDLKFLRLMDKKVKKIEGHYMLPLPLKNPAVKLPNNRKQAEQRLKKLRKRFQNDQNFFKDYKAFMEEVIDKGYAQRSTSDVSDGKLWYIPHFGVYDPNKPGKIRIVFDCSAEYGGTSLNQNLMSGPDLTNQLIGVLMRFRQEKVAFMADIEKMFYQVRVPEDQRSLLRYLWWPESKFDDQEPVEFEMNVHLFGAVSSPSCSNYALKRIVTDDVGDSKLAAKETIKRNFYVDDLLKSVQSQTEAMALMKDVVQLCADGGFNLTKFIANDKEVLKSIPEEKRRKNVKEFEITDQSLPTEKALGVVWNVEEDRFGFQVELKEKLVTRRGMLSLLSKVYDPCGFVSPFVLEGRRIIQQTCRQEAGWDDPLPVAVVDEWLSWCTTLENLRDVKIDRCYKAPDFNRVIHCSLHHFSDASESGYGQVSYLRFLNEDGKIHCSMVMGKSRVAPLKYISMPRLELTAAVLSVKVSIMIRTELEYTIHQEVFWSDSQVVLSYIRNTEKRFKIFVANRIQYINDHTEPKQWCYIPSQMNPADCSSRGFSKKTSAKYESQVQQWFNGPAFLWKATSEWPRREMSYEVLEDDPEVKTEVQNFKIAVEDGNILQSLEARISEWEKMKRVMVHILRFVKKFRLTPGETTTVKEKEFAGREILRLVQERHFKEELKQLKNGNQVQSKILSLNPFIGHDGLIRVGGRIKRADLEYDVIHPILLPKKTAVTTLIIRNCHSKVAHGGRNLTLNEVRSSGFWIMSASSAVRSILYHCVKCRHLRGKVGEQLMSDLPKERLQCAPPFTYCGVDMFGPFVVKKGRTEFKRYGAMFTCFSSRAVHIEVTCSMETDSFILALRRFVARRGNVRSIRSDNGSNFIGAKAELQKAFQEMQHENITRFLANLGADWIIWKTNPPAASHHGGVWERQIKSARSILTAIMQTHPGTLNDESLCTLMAEAEAIINSRPLTGMRLHDSC
ncbi:MAG: DUF1759 domain-containing protein [Bacteroidota bacterium]